MEKKTKEKKDKVFCDICGEGFKTSAALQGHKRFAHMKALTKTYPDEIGKRLANLESLAVASGKASNPGNPVNHTEASLVIALKTLLPDMEKFGMVVVNFGSRYDDDYLEMKRCRIIKDPAFSQAGFGGLVLSDTAVEL